MELKQEQKDRILDAVRADRAHYPSDAKHATALGLSSSVYNALKQGKDARQLSQAGWLGLARRLDVSLRNEGAWVAVETEAYSYITGQLSACQDRTLSAILVDVPNIGKTYTARIYARTHRNVVYVDCSQVKTKTRLIKAIANGFGLSISGQYTDVYDRLCKGLERMSTPLVILDEAGDLQHEAFLELKALWNATEHCCGWYMMGADGLKAKINRCIEYDKVGYAEIFSRFGNRYSRVTPENIKEREAWLMSEALMVAKANAPEYTDARKIARQAQGSLRRVYTEVQKIRMGYEREDETA